MRRTRHCVGWHWCAEQGIVLGGTGAQNKALCLVALVRRTRHCVAHRCLITTRRQWSILSDMPEVCSYGAAVTLNDCIYVVGGHNRTCLKYDPALDNWTIGHS